MRWKNESKRSSQNLVVVMGSNPVRAWIFVENFEVLVQ